MHEKLGVENQELLSELRAKYNDLRGKQLTKTAAEEVTRIEDEMRVIKAKIAELEAV